MPAKLRMTVEEEARDIPCEPVVTIGRVDGNTIVLPDPKASRHHAMVRVLGKGQCYLVDTGSSNGTFLNGRRISVPVEPKDGDRIEIGGNHIVFVGEQQDGAGLSDTESIVLAPSTLLTVGGVVERITILVADVWGYTMFWLRGRPILFPSSHLWTANCRRWCGEMRRFGQYNEEFCRIALGRRHGGRNG